MASFGIHVYYTPAGNNGAYYVLVGELVAAAVISVALAFVKFDASHTVVDE